MRAGGRRVGVGGAGGRLGAQLPVVGAVVRMARRGGRFGLVGVRGGRILDVALVGGRGDAFVTNVVHWTRMLDGAQDVVGVGAGGQVIVESGRGVRSGGATGRTIVVRGGLGRVGTTGGRETILETKGVGVGSRDGLQTGEGRVEGGEIA